MRKTSLHAAICGVLGLAALFGLGIPLQFYRMGVIYPRVQALFVVFLMISIYGCYCTVKGIIWALRDHHEIRDYTRGGKYDPKRYLLMGGVAFLLNYVVFGIFADFIIVLNLLAAGICCVVASKIYKIYDPIFSGPKLHLGKDASRSIDQDIYGHNGR